MKNNFTLCLLFMALLGIVSCKKKSEDIQPAEETPITPEKNLKLEFLTTYANIAHSTASEAKAAALLLKTAIDDFVASPSAAKLTACKTAYETARKTYLQTEAFRGVSGPIDVEDGAPESWMNSWPLDEVYIDFVFNGANDPVVNTDTAKVDSKLQGLVNDRSQIIDKPTLLGLNTTTGDANVTVGYHAIEFLLWGQDIYESTAGQRPYTDFVTGATATAPNGDRRGAYLKACAELLVENLGLVVDAWEPGDATNFRADFLKESNTEARLKTILAGMTKLTKNEFGGERILPALDHQDQEEEHSCFSDLTKVDFKYDVLGYENIILGVHKLQTGVISVSGTGLKKLLEASSSENASKLQVSIDSLKLTTEVVFNASARYDQIIAKDDADADVKAVKEMSDAWVRFSDALNEATQTFGYGVVDTTPEE